MILTLLARLQVHCASAWMSWKGRTRALSQHHAGASGKCSLGRALGRAAGRTWEAWERSGRLCRKPWSCPPNTPPS